MAKGMTYSYHVKVNGEPLDFENLPPEEQNELREIFADTLAKNLGYERVQDEQSCAM